MNKLTMNQIDFIKHKLEEFIGLPSSPNKEQLSQDNPNSSQFSKSPNKPKQKENSKKNPKQSHQTQKENKKWLAKKQNDILQYITNENRSRNSVLNKFLNSDKIYLKKREDVDKHFQSKQRQQMVKIQEKQDDKNFSFDQGLSSLKKVYKNIGDFLVKRQNINQNSDDENQDKKQSPENSQIQLLKLLNNIQSKSEINPNQKENKKPIFHIETNMELVKPSDIRGKFLQTKKQEMQTPRISNFTYGNDNKTNLDFAQMRNIFNSGTPKNNNQISSINKKSIEKVEQKISAQPRKKSSSIYNTPNENEARKRHNSISRKDRNQRNNISPSLSRKSFQFFESERPSTIRAPPKTKYSPTHNSKQKASQQYSPSKSNTPTKYFPSSVYKKTFKQNPYELTNYQKFSINKYRTKQISPDQRRNLKQKYELLDQRLGKILQTVKNEKDNGLECFSSPNIQRKQLPYKKAQIPEKILIYHKFSPLKKILKTNRQHRMKFNPDQI